MIALREKIPGKHLLFYDGSCGFCDWMVQWVVERDAQEIFAFAPLQGVTAQMLLHDMPESEKALDSLVLIENVNEADKSIHIMGKGAFRVLWLLGGKWKCLGWIYFFPGFLYNWGYRLVAANRKHLFSSCPLPAKKALTRFLP